MKTIENFFTIFNEEYNATLITIKPIFDNACVSIDYVIKIIEMKKTSIL